MAFESCELKLRTLATEDANMQADLGISPMRWFDRQLVQGDIGEPADQKACVTVQRVSTIREYNAGGLGSLSQPRLQINVICYDAEKARRVAADVADFIGTIDLTDPGEFQSPFTTPTRSPAFLLNQRAGMLPELHPPAYVETLDYRFFNREDFPSS